MPGTTHTGMVTSLGTPEPPRDPTGCPPQLETSRMHTQRWAGCVACTSPPAVEFHIPRTPPCTLVTQDP